MPLFFIPNKNQSLLFQLSFFVILITVVALTLLGGYRYQQQSLQLETELNSLLISNTNFLADTLEVPIYSYDLETTETICKALIHVKEIVFVDVEVDTKTSVPLAFSKDEKGVITRSNSLPTNAKAIWHKQDIVYKKKKIGVATIGVTERYLNDQLNSTMMLVVIQIALLVLLLVVPLIALLRFLFVNPIQQLTKMSSRISEGGLEKIIVSYRTKELDKLATTLSSMQGSIKRQLEALNSEVIERKQAEASLSRLRLFLSNIIDSMPSVLIGIDIEGKVTQWNTEAAKFTGISEQNALDQFLSDTFPRLYADMDLVREAIRSREKQSVSNRRYKQDDVDRYEDLTIYPLVTNGIEGAVIRLDDITEKNINETALRRSQKMEAIGQLTGGIAHDFNNILGIVMGNLQLLQMEWAGDDKALERIENALRGTQRGAEITRKLLIFSRNKTSETKIVYINEILANMDELISKSLTVSIKVKTDFYADLWPVRIDSGDLEDAILNLSLNAKDAMPEGGNLVIESSNKILDEGYVALNPESRSGDFVMISVSDDGIGMTDDVKDKILEPFFTTKVQGKGTGLGLSMVYGFVQHSGGHIKIYSELGKGTTFHIFIPRAEEGDQPGEAREFALSELPRGTETILVVDDEEDLVELASEYLNYLGYSVLTAVDAGQAMKVLDGDDCIDLVFTDIIMPGDIDGYQLAEKIHNEHPEYKILLTSGFTKRKEDKFGSENAFILKLSENRLQKPYNQSELAIAIRRSLDERT